MLIQLDSSYRDYNKYPYNSDFSVNVNGQPPNSNDKNDVRNTFITRDYIQFGFRWIGNSSFNNPLSLIDNDTFLTKIVPIAPNRCVIVPEDNIVRGVIGTINYFVGVEMWNKDTNSSGVIIEYDKNYLLVTLDSDIFSIYFSGVSIDDIDYGNMIEFYIDGYFINTSYHQKKNLILLGVTNVGYQESNKFVLETGAYTGMIVENVTRNWKTTIREVQGLLQNVILENIPSFQANDFFIAYQNPTLIRREALLRMFENGLKEYSIEFVENETLLQKDEIFTDGNVSMKVKQKSPLQMEILNPGKDLSKGETLVLLSITNKISVRVDSVGGGVVLTENIVIPKDQYIIAILNVVTVEIQYYNIDIVIDGKIVFIEYMYNDFDTINKNPIIYCYFIPYIPIFPNVNIPMIPTQNQVCVRARLVSLTLPNLPICGYNIYLADIPYVFVGMYNVDGQGNQIGTNLYSNIPAASTNNFICPIANVKNPRRNFVNIVIRQNIIFRFTPRDSLRLRISLPNGNILKFAENQYQNTFNCPPLDLPLNKNTKENQKKIFPYMLGTSIVALFEIDFK